MTTATGEFAIAALSRTGVQPFTPIAARMVRRKEGPRRDTLTEDQRFIAFDLEFANGERLQVKLVGSGQEPTSLWHALNRIEHLSRLPSGWDSYGARPLSARAVRRSFELFSLLLDDRTPEPNVIPTREGGLQFEWHRQGIDLEVTCESSGVVSYYYADSKSGEEREGVNGATRQAVRDILRRLSHPA
jgi:hypothetical protein